MVLSIVCYCVLRVCFFIRTPDIVCRRTYILPVFLLSSFFRPLDIVLYTVFLLLSFFLSFLLSFLLSLFFRPLNFEVAEQNSTKIGHMVGSKCNLKTHVWNLGYPFSLQIGGPKQLFGPTSQLKGNFNGLYLRNETRYRQSVKCVDNYRGLIHRPKMSWTLLHKQLQIRPPFLPNPS